MHRFLDKYQTREEMDERIVNKLLNFLIFRNYLIIRMQYFRFTKWLLWSVQVATLVAPKSDIGGTKV